MNINNHPKNNPENLWDANEPAYKKLILLKAKTPEEIYENWQDAFTRKPTTVVCIDERVSLQDPNEPEIGIAGTLVLMNNQDFNTTIQKLKKAGVQKITYHDQCGAVALAKKLNNDDREVIEIARSAAKRVATALDLPEPDYLGYDQESQLKMTGNAQFHHARAIVVDGTGNFNPSLVNFPSHFLISAFYEPNLEYTSRELEIALNIALGDHGFGREKFAIEPIAIILVGGQNEYSLENMQNFFKDILTQYKEYLSIIGIQKSA